MSKKKSREKKCTKFIREKKIGHKKLRKNSAQNSWTKKK